uniref:Uncharacterized protein n=1 Tax=Micrurus paraensis TaxID=1970185 RepID=A0A2D4KZG2_9SAUR
MLHLPGHSDTLGTLPKHTLLKCVLHLHHPSHLHTPKFPLPPAGSNLHVCWPIGEPPGTCNSLPTFSLSLIVGSQQEVLRRTSLCQFVESLTLYQNRWEKSQALSQAKCNTGNL